MHLELCCDRSERPALAVSTGGGGDSFVGHLADDATSRHVAVIEMGHDGGAMDAEVASEVVDGHPTRVLGDKIVDICGGEPSQDRV